MESPLINKIYILIRGSGQTYPYARTFKIMDSRLLISGKTKDGVDLPAFRMIRVGEIISEYTLKVLFCCRIN